MHPGYCPLSLPGMPLRNTPSFLYAEWKFLDPREAVICALPDFSRQNLDSKRLCPPDSLAGCSSQAYLGHPGLGTTSAKAPFFACSLALSP